jgi:hypothetical protein
MKHFERYTIKGKIVRNAIRLLCSLMLALCLFRPNTCLAQDVLVSGGIPPVIQQQSEWCWIAVAQMVFMHFNVPAANPIDYQCGIAAGIGPICNYSCSACNIPAPTPQIIQKMLWAYPVLAAQVNHTFRAGITSTLSGPLTFPQIQAEIPFGPIIAVIAPYGSQHVVLVVGYNAQNQALIINDPYFYTPFQPDPYTPVGGTQIQPGQYRISYASFLNPVRWNTSIHQLH